MALTLDPILSAAMDGNSHQPIVEITSGSRVADIPFDGTLLTQETFDEFSPATITYNTGRLVLAYAFNAGGGTNPYGIKFVTTDVDRTVFTTVTIPLTTFEIRGVTVCELTDGSIGIAYLENDTNNHLYRLQRKIVTIAGTAISNAEIANWSHDTYTSDPWVQTLGPDSYVIAYGKASGSDYYLYKRTSSDFLTWTGESALAIGGIDTTFRLSNPSLVIDSTATIWIWFDALESTGPNNEELTNVYYSTTTDLSTWINAVKVTNYTQYSETGSHSVTLQKVAGSMDLIYNRIVSVLKMDDSTAGWCHYGSGAIGLQWDSVNRKLYAMAGYMGGGGNAFFGVVKIDVDTWTVDKYWDDTTTPGFPSWVGHDIGGGGYRPYSGEVRGENHIVAVMPRPDWVANEAFALFILDGEADSITEYHFCSSTTNGTVQNVTCPTLKNGSTVCGGARPYVPRFVEVDLSTNRAYITAPDNSGLANYLAIVYLDLTQPGPAYTATTLIDIYNTGGFSYEFVGIQLGAGGVRIFPTEGLVVMASQFSNWDGWLRVFLLSDGTEWKNYRFSTFSDFPKQGIYGSLYCENSKIYCGFPYLATDGQVNNRGLLIIDLNVDSFTYVRPTYASLDDYGFGTMDIIRGEPNEIILCSNIPYHAESPNTGIVIYNEVTGVWKVYNNTTIPGLGDPNYQNSSLYNRICYDLVGKRIMGFQSNFAGSRTGKLAMFSVYGFMKQAMQSEGTYSGGNWTFGTAIPAVQGYYDYDMVVSADPASASSMYVFWVQQDSGTGEKSIKWDRDMSAFDLSRYLNGEVVIHHSIDENPYTLEFTLSEGHLFDPFNALSLLSMYLKKGRKIILRAGEKESGTDYWQNLGTFYVTETKVSFSRGKYTNISVSCADERALWIDHQIYATDHYGAQNPEIVAEGLMTDLVDMAPARLGVPTFWNSSPITHQWIETTLGEILKNISDRFGYSFGFTVDDVFTARRITTTGTVVHTYADLGTIIEYAPDNSQSDFTNHVTVFGQELTQLETIMAEERVGTIQGTFGWWGFKNDFEVAYSKDFSRTCKEPRLVVTESAMSIGFQLAGDVTESITTIDVNNKYCIVRVDAPNLAPILATLISGDLYMAFVQPDWTIQGTPGSWMPTINIGRIVERTMMIATLMILASVGNFQYEVWAKPLGYQYRKVQSSAATGDDPIGQVESGMLIEKKVTDPLCYSQQDCNQVADFEIMVIKAQRNRITLTKDCHLQDEIADTIRVPHPISGHDIDIFITEITRRIQIRDGGMQDEIQGWKVN